MADLKILMVGGRRCGKTSALASLFDQMIHGATNKVLTVADITKSEEKTWIDANGQTRTEKKESLANKQVELEYAIENGGTNSFMIDNGPTMFFWDYVLKLLVPGQTSRCMNLMFRDSAGEFFDTSSIFYEDTRRFVAECDVFIVVVDTPYLMAKDSIAKAANQVGSIHTFLTGIDNQEGRKAKQVIFVPIKCEKWIKDDKINDVGAKIKINDVVERIKVIYGPLITHLEASNKTEISIIPIETAGDIVFDKLREPWTLTKPNCPPMKCAKISEEIVRDKNGEIVDVEEGDILDLDMNATFPGTKNVTRPTAWFRLRQNAEYSPHNCEQLPLHIIRFMFNKAKMEVRDDPRVRMLDNIRRIPLLGSVLEPILRELLERLGFNTMRLEDVQKALDTLSENNLLKDTGDGITIIKKCF